MDWKPDLDPIKMRNMITGRIDELKDVREKLIDANTEKANAIAQHNKNVAVTILKLKNKYITEWEMQKIENLPANAILKVAEGICFQTCYNKELYEGYYKALLSTIESLKAELNGYQSANKHLE